MKVAGFSFVRNAVKFDYPVVESIKSVLPLVDAFYAAVGDSEDETRKLIEGIDSDKIQIIDTVWDDSLREGGKVLAVETNKAFDAIPKNFDWCFYIQGDEVVHEQYYETIKKGMAKHLANPKVEGLLFHYRHFFGSYDYYGDSRKWYRNEVRIIRNDKRIRSHKDAQGFRKEGRKLDVALIPAYIFHYGWVKDPKTQQQKQENFHKYWHSDEWIEENAPQSLEGQDEFNYHKVDSLARFKGTHPEVMKERIGQKNWNFQPDLKKKNYKLKYALLVKIEQLTGWRPGEYKNFNRVL